MEKATYKTSLVFSFFDDDFPRERRNMYRRYVIFFYLSYVSKILFDMSTPRDRNRFVLDGSLDSALMSGLIKEEILLGIVSRIKHLVTKENGYRSLE